MEYETERRKKGQKYKQNKNTGPNPTLLLIVYFILLKIFINFSHIYFLPQVSQILSFPSLPKSPISLKQNKSNVQNSVS